MSGKPGRVIKAHLPDASQVDTASGPCRVNRQIPQNTLERFPQAGGHLVFTAPNAQQVFGGFSHALLYFTGTGANGLRGQLEVLLDFVSGGLVHVHTGRDGGIPGELRSRPRLLRS